jgi:NAD(P)-dependent dehydrogenase (short-subunit alcohol dehydrogenase family)
MFPAKRLVPADDVAAAAEFLLGPAAASVTGHVLPVDGGLSSLHPHRAQEYGV